MFTATSSGRGPRQASYDIKFTDLCYTVTDRATGQPKDILSNVSGLASAGRMLALMGASGAGKTTLLDTLAGNSFSGTSLSGQILVNGKPRRRAAFSKLSCYVQQKDILSAASTVREAIMTSALLRMPVATPMAEKRAAVEEVLKELDLLKCADTLIGDEVLGIKGISGGQKRRVSVGVELVKDPKIIFLDEPTSGLDSEMARGVVELLVSLARKTPQRTVVCTIHQPSSDITELFDDYLLLASGRVVYSGVWDGAVGHFESCGYKCPNYKNPTDFFMSVIKDPDAADALSLAFEKRAPQLLAEQQRVATRQRLALPPSASSNAFNNSGVKMAGGAAEPGASAVADASPSTSSYRPTLSGGQSSRLDQQSRGNFATIELGSARGGGTDGAAGDAAPPGNGHVVLEVTAAGAVAAVLASPKSTAAGGKGGEDVGGGDGYDDAAALEQQQEQHQQHQQQLGEEEEAVATAATPIWYQSWVLAQRNWRNWIRNPIMLSSELVQYIFLALFIGLMYMQFTSKAEEGTFDRSACIWFAFTVLCFTPSYTAITAWDRERHLLKRELKQRQYNVVSYYLARYAVLIPFEVVQCLIFTSVMYFMAGFQANFEKFIIFFAVLSMFQIISEGLGLLCGVVTRQATYAVIILTFILLLMLSFSGFLTSQIPVYFKWLSDVSYLTYAYNALLKSEMTGLTLTEADGTKVDGSTLLPDSVAGGLTFAQNVGVLAAQMAGMEIVKVIALLLAVKFDLM